MSEPSTVQAVADAGGAWRDGVDVVSGVADPDRLRVLAELLGADRPPDDVVPPLWTTVLATTWPAYEELGPDGHPATGVGLPPMPDRRRLFAGGRLQVLAPLAVGEPVIRRSQVLGVRVSDGRSGALLFVTVQHTFSGADGAAAVLEEQDLAYRSGPSAAPAAPAAPATPSGDDAAAPDLSFTPDAVTLFRFSALTGNSHRIHYDEPYATAVEGLPGRLVHGPLLALLLLEPDRRAGRPVTGFSYRLLRPVPLGAVVDVRRTAREGGAGVVATAGGECATGEVETEDGS